MLDKLEPKKIIIVSSAPQIRYPDCYGIDMSKMGEFVAFRAMLELLKERGEHIMFDEKLLAENENLAQKWYNLFSEAEISAKIAQMIKQKSKIQAEVEVIYQSIENLHQACPNHQGDWYFTGNYPTPGGYKVVNKSLKNFLEGRLERAY
jgi:amidophosphoribosyltransferase